MASSEEEIPVESAPPAGTEGPATTTSKTDELLKVVDDSEEPDVFKSAVGVSSSVDDDYEDDEKDYVEHIEHVTPEDEENDDDNDNDWEEVLPPPPPPVKADDVDEKYESTVTPLTPSTVAATAFASVASPAGQKQKEDENAEPDFSNCKTNVGKRLWLAQEKADNAGQKSSPDMVPLTREFQKFRKQLNSLIRCIDEYHDAMRVMKAKRAQVSIDMSWFQSICVHMSHDFVFNF
jgi:hypothetical protein